MNDNSTRSRPPESDGKRRWQSSDSFSDLQSQAEVGPTDFASLLATPVAQAERPKEMLATDFHSLAGKRPGAPKPYQARSITDLLLDCMTPIMIVVMVYSVIFFLLDVRFIFTEVHDANLRWVAFCFVVGVVALNRLIARDGKDESLMYVGGLGMAIGLYTVVTTTSYGVGSVARGFMNSVGAALVFNLTIVAFVWWLANRLTHECCVDENRTAGDIGILTGTARRLRTAMEPKSKTPKIQTTMDAVDPSEWKKPQRKAPPKPADATERLSKRHPGISIFYFSIPVFIIFALGQRVVQHGGEFMILAGHFYIGAYALSALSLLMLSSLAGLRDYFRSRRVHLPSGIGPFWIGLGSVMILMVLFAAIALPTPSLPPIAVVQNHQYDYWRPGSSFQLMNFAVPAAQAIQQSHAMERIGIGVLILFGIFLLYGLMRVLGAFAVQVAKRRHSLPQPVVRFFNALDRILERLGRLPELPKFQKRRRISRNVSMAAKCENPMTSTRLSTTAQRIEACYDAMCA
ncbi:MAG: hypothetical protein WC655_18790, partial [Candidatus Hydrogenedentales bacterium]